MNYDVHRIEKKWREYWQEHPFRTGKTGEGRKFYCLDMFPYPSGSGLHVGHWRGYVLSDVYARIKWLQGYNVLHPMGWDAFGLPAENDAIKKGIHPHISTQHNIANFKEQLQHIAALYDWDKEINTTDPEYYKWTQWIFLQMFKAGLAYQASMPINWCPSCLTGLANEEVVGGVCERCNSTVEQKLVTQWMLKITAYAEKLLQGLDTLQWPEKVKVMQRNWIGKSEGAQVFFTTESSVQIPVYTTRPDTIFGVTFLVMAPDHVLVEQLVKPNQVAAVRAYQEKVAHLTSLQRSVGVKEKDGVFTGSYALHPFTKVRLPIYLASYVFKGYGTGTVMAVPAHDERDFAFAQIEKLPIKQVVSCPAQYLDAQGNMVSAYEGDGVLIDSGVLTGLQAHDGGIKRAVELIQECAIGTRQVTYKLRDWVFSRQRYWGEPIPLVHCGVCGIVPVKESDLPVTLPDVERYEPTGTGDSPLAGIQEWVHTSCPVCAGPARRETNTMPQWAGSCWYFLRYPNPQVHDAPFATADMRYWLPVDLYVGGIEHAILHLLYARFYVKVLHDLGHISFDEPFMQLFNQGMVLKYSEKTGLVEKMSKSKGNVVSPDEMVAKYGSDVLRMYILFMGPPELDCEWQDAGLEGIKRFLHKLWAVLTDEKRRGPVTDIEKKVVHLFLKEYQERLDAYKPNTAIARFMELVHQITDEQIGVSIDTVEVLAISISVLAPHFASEILELVVGKKLSDCAWPVYDPVYAAVSTIEMAVQVNGKLRGTVVVPVSMAQDDVVAASLGVVERYMDKGTIVKTIFVPHRLVNFVVK